jgi:hypothetical protein
LFAREIFERLRFEGEIATKATWSSVFHFASLEAHSLTSNRPIKSKRFQGAKIDTRGMLSARFVAGARKEQAKAQPPPRALCAEATEIIEVPYSRASNAFYCGERFRGTPYDRGKRGLGGENSDDRASQGAGHNILMDGR